MASFGSRQAQPWSDQPHTTYLQVQQGCIPAVLEGRDVIGTAHTGSGKTAAFALPILQKLAADPLVSLRWYSHPPGKPQLADGVRAGRRCTGQYDVNLSGAAQHLPVITGVFEPHSSPLLFRLSALPCPLLAGSWQCSWQTNSVPWVQACHSR